MTRITKKQLESMEAKIEVAKSLAARALPCPFCGEKLVVHANKYGCSIGHPAAQKTCILRNAIFLEQCDLAAWNMRYTKGRS